MLKISHESTKLDPRLPRSVINEVQGSHATKSTYYSCFSDLCKRIKMLKWTVKELDDRLVLRKNTALMLPELEIMIDDSLWFTVSVYGWQLPEDHTIFSTNFRSVCNISVSDILKSVINQLICAGVNPDELSSSIVHHVIPKSADPLYSGTKNDFDSFPHQAYRRTRGCEVLIQNEKQCGCSFKYTHKLNSI